MFQKKFTEMFQKHSFLSPPVQLARWALMRHFASVCASRFKLITRRVMELGL